MCPSITQLWWATFQVDGSLVLYWWTTMQKVAVQQIRVQGRRVCRWFLWRLCASSSKRKQKCLSSSATKIISLTYVNLSRTNTCHYSDSLMFFRHISLCGKAKAVPLLWSLKLGAHSVPQAHVNRELKNDSSYDCQECLDEEQAFSLSARWIYRPMWTQVPILLFLAYVYLHLIPERN